MVLKMQMIATQRTKVGNITCVAEIGAWTKIVSYHRRSRRDQVVRRLDVAGFSKKIYIVSNGFKFLPKSVEKIDDIPKLIFD